MSFSINTNVASLQAQNYLRTNSDFQNKTISRVTSGLRIVQSGDDAAGLAIANGYRSDEAVLSQGVRNANDGLSQLQIIDGGMSNISMLLDRARTLATQSASGTFTGDRTVLNSEFQSVLQEIDRQSQSIGLDTGGIFAKNLSVFIGGGKANNGISDISNGSVSVDLTSSTVDTKSLGLKGAPAINSNAYSLGNNSNTSVANVTAANSADSTVDFYFQGPGFGDTNKVKVSVQKAGLTDTNTLLTAINSAINVTANLGSSADTAFKNAGITAQIVTDSDGNQKLAFASSDAAFQVEAGNKLANALLGNFDATTPALGAALNTHVAGSSALVNNGASAETLNFEIRGAGMTAPVTFSVAHTGAAADILTGIQAQITSLNGSNAEFARAGITASIDSSNKLAFTSTSGEKFTVAAAGDADNYLGFGTALSGTAGGNGSAAQYTSITAATTVGGGTGTPADGDVAAFNVSVGGQASVEIKTGILAAATDTADTMATALNQAIATAGGDLVKAGLTVTAASGKLVFSSSNGTTFQLGVNTTDSVSDQGFGLVGDTTAHGLPGLATAASLATSPVLDSGSVNQSSPLSFTGIRFGAEKQSLTVTATDSSGVLQTKSISLDTTNARDIDDAVHKINNDLQLTNNPILQAVVAVKAIDSSGNEKIMFQSAKSPFTVTIGAGTYGDGLSMSTGTPQGISNSSSTAGGGTTTDISTQAGAQLAVSSLAGSVGILGTAQAVVGKGENTFNYAVNLAQSQLTNLATAESRIRDADLASEAANLTKAQILLQAGVAALAQANSAPQQVLSLLK